MRAPKHRSTETPKHRNTAPPSPLPRRLHHLRHQFRAGPVVAREDLLDAPSGIDDYGAEIVADAAGLIVPEGHAELLSDSGNVDELAGGEGPMARGAVGGVGVDFAARGRGKF